MPVRSDRGHNANNAAADSADYIADLTKELAAIARGSRLDLLAYLLDVAHLEASEKAGRNERGAGTLQLARPARG